MTAAEKICSSPSDTSAFSEKYRGAELQILRTENHLKRGFCPKQSIVKRTNSPLPVLCINTIFILITTHFIHSCTFACNFHPVSHYK